MLSHRPGLISPTKKNCTFHAAQIVVGRLLLSDPSRWRFVIHRYAGTTAPYRHNSSSSTRWKSRQGRDSFARAAKIEGLKSRAAFKLLEIDAKYRLFKAGQTVVDLGYAPGSWSQVAVERTKPYGRIIGIDVIPAQPPRGVSTIQGNFLSTEVQAEVKRFLSDPESGWPRSSTPQQSGSEFPKEYGKATFTKSTTVVLDDSGLLPIASLNTRSTPSSASFMSDQRTVDIILSDMCDPWQQTEGFRKRSLSNPYTRMMNTSGLSFKDHAGSMDLCAAALRFSYDVLRIGGHLVCKFYQGAEEKRFENQLKMLFHVVHRDKPVSSRNESKEAYFIALRRKADISGEQVFGQVES